MNEENKLGDTWEAPSGTRYVVTAIFNGCLALNSNGIRRAHSPARLLAHGWRRLPATPAPAEGE